jgi:xanthine dehydrogenase accessory factor
LLRAAEGGEPVFLASVLEAGPRSIEPGARLLVERSGERIGSLGDAVLDDALAAYAPEAFPRHLTHTLYVTPDGLSERTVIGATAIYVEIVEAKPVFLVVGGGHIGRSLSKLADFLDFHVAVLDDREDFANEERLPEADQVICEDYEEALEKFPIGPNTYITLVTRGHKQDELSLRKCLGRGAAYLADRRCLAASARRGLRPGRTGAGPDAHWFEHRRGDAGRDRNQHHGGGDHDAAWW